MDSHNRIMTDQSPTQLASARNIASGIRNKVNKARKPRRGAAANPEIQTAIAELVQRGVTSSPEIRRKLVNEYGFLWADTPSENTILDLVKEMIARAESAEWNLADAHISEIPLVLPVWTYARSKGLKLSTQEAQWVVRIRTAAPDLPLDDVLGLAGLRVLWPDSADWIDALIGFAPWRDSEHAERYFAAVNAGHISTTLAAAHLSKRAFLQDDGRHVVRDAESWPETVAYFENLAKQPTPVITIKGDEVSITYENRKGRMRKKGGK